MPTRNLHDSLLVERALVPQTITGSNLTSNGVDLRGFDSNLLVIDMANIPELGASPVGSAAITITVQDSDDDSTYAAVSDAEVDGQTLDSNGQVSLTNDANAPFAMSYIGSKRYVRVVLAPTGISTGGAIGVIAIKGHAHYEPVSNVAIS